MDNGELVAYIEEYALNPGTIELTFPGMDDLLLRVLLRSRRLRVMDWLAQSGMSMLNVIPECSQRFLHHIQVYGARDKYLSALEIANSTVFFADLVNESLWRDLALFEAYVILTRDFRDTATFVTNPEKQQLLLLNEGIFVFQTYPEVVAIHARLPQYAIDEASANQIYKEESAISTSDRISFIAIQSTTEAAGFTAEIDFTIFKVLSSMRELPATWETVIQVCGSETAEELAQLKAFRYA